jgi:predicted Ser/Thr protein kinase
MSASAQLTRSDLERSARTPLGKPSALKPSVWRVETPDGPLVVKDASTSAVAVRWLARWLLARERRILERLGGVEGVPQLEAVVDRDAFALTLLPGRPLDGETFAGRPRELIQQLTEITRQLHERGVFHLDLHQRKNLLVDEAGRLQLVDFGAAVAPGRVVRALLGPALRAADRQAAYKYLARFAPEALTEEEARAVLRQRALRRLWPFSRPGRGQREEQAARRRLG